MLYLEYHLAFHVNTSWNVIFVVKPLLNLDHCCLLSTLCNVFFANSLTFFRNLCIYTCKFTFFHTKLVTYSPLSQNSWSLSQFYCVTFFFFSIIQLLLYEKWLILQLHLLITKPFTVYWWFITCQFCSVKIHLFLPYVIHALVVFRLCVKKCYPNILVIAIS